MNHVLHSTFAILFFLFATTSWAASTKQEVQELKEQVEALRQGQEQIQKDLQEVLDLVKQGARPSPAAPGFTEQVVEIGSSPFKGDASAPITLIEYSDYQCPFCARHYRDVMPSLVADYVDTGKLKYVMKENPIESIHPMARGASLAALCAGDQGKYWEMHNIMFDNQKELAVANLKSYAADIGLDTPEFDDCLDSGKFEKDISDDLAASSRMGMRGTPGFLLGLTDPADPGKANMTLYIRGAQPLDNFKRAIEDLLESGDEG